MAENLSCKICHNNFEVTDRELTLLSKVAPKVGSEALAIPVTAICPRCKERERLLFRNERNLYKRTCSKTGRSLVSIYPQTSPYVIYDQSVWWSDEYDPFEYGREFDFSRSFFEQFQELHESVPKVAINNAKSENCAYTNYSAENKNCYLVVGGLGSEDCYYSYRVFYSRNVIDCYDLLNCELCYECLQCTDLYNSKFCAECSNSSDLIYCEDCVGCRSCYGCIGLRNVSFSIFNEPVSERAYSDHLRQIEGSPEKAEALRRKFLQSMPRRALLNVSVEQCSGDSLLNCKDCYNCFVLKNSQDCGYFKFGENNKDSWHCNFSDNCQLQYHSSNLEKNYNICFCSLTWFASDCYYLMNCFNCKNAFGCTGLKTGEYVILNKKYSRQEYERFLPRIIRHMQETEEWGSYFPAKMSPFGYNESVANDLYPLSAEDAHSLGFRWTEWEAASNEKGSEREVASSASILSCRSCNKSYKVLLPEASFYQRMELTVPSECPECRHRSRMGKRRSFDAREAICLECGNFTTTYLPTGLSVLCESCYAACER